MTFYVERKTIRKIPGTVIKAAPIPDPEVVQGFGTREHVGEICAKAGERKMKLLKVFEK